MKSQIRYVLHLTFCWTLLITHFLNNVRNTNVIATSGCVWGGNKFVTLWKCRKFAIFITYHYFFHATFHKWHQQHHNMKLLQFSPRINGTSQIWCNDGHGNMNENGKWKDQLCKFWWIPYHCHIATKISHRITISLNKCVPVISGKYKERLFDLETFSIFITKPGFCWKTGKTDHWNKVTKQTKDTDYPYTLPKAKQTKKHRLSKKIT